MPPACSAQDYTHSDLARDEDRGGEMRGVQGGIGIVDIPRSTHSHQCCVECVKGSGEGRKGRRTSPVDCALAFPSARVPCSSEGHTTLSIWIVRYSPSTLLRSRLLREAFLTSRSQVAILVTFYSFILLYRTLWHFWQNVIPVRTGTWPCSLL